ncbi:pentapeptide repeat-containing protein [Paenibacillus sp. TAB 01]|uniref:pentapeptide repeat-containing protein n=1 Tax=Paenibacillus sp. TAB 01 TaxID=3368988 RepID=UPI0037538E9C
MDQYFLSRVRRMIDSIGKKEIYEGIIISDERKDKELKWDHRTINHSTFAKVSFKESTLSNCNFSLSVFIDCYFKKTSLENINFVGCKFINCTFDNIKLVQCDIRFTVFENCYIEYDEVKNCLPAQSNIRWKMCTNLALESLRAGDSENYRKFFFEEKSACEEHYLGMLLQKEKYYKQKYDTIDRIVGLIKYINSQISKLIWGYGERIQNLVVVIFFILLIFAICYNMQDSVFKEANSSQAIAKKLNFSESLYLSFCNFLTITSDFTSINPFVRTITVIEGTFGVVLMGFFVAALFRFINRR